jgi:hypothetical protein
MWLVLAVASAAEPEGLDQWQLVTPQPQPHWVVGSGRVWLRDGPDCLPVRVDDAARGLLAAETCRQGPVVCETVMDLSEGLVLRSDRCTLEESGRPGPTQSSPREGVPTPFARASADEQVVQFLPVSQLAAWSLDPTVEVAPCDKRSLKVLRREGTSPPGVVEGQRRCNVSSRIGVDLPVQGRPPELEQVVRTEPVDCTTPCADNPIQQQLAELNTALKDQWYARTSASGPRLYREAQACKEASDTPAMLARDACAHAQRMLMVAPGIGPIHTLDRPQPRR